MRLTRKQAFREERTGQDDDFSWVSSCLEGDESGFDRLIEKYQKPVFAFVFQMTGGERETSAELTQEVFLKIYRNLDRFRGQAKFSTWAFSIASNHCKNYLKAKNVRNKSFAQRLGPTDGDPAPTGGGMEIPDRRKDPQREAERNAAARELNQALKNLQEIYREPVVLRDVYDFSYTEISEALNINEGTVKSRIARGRLMLAEMLKEKGL